LSTTTVTEHEHVETRERLLEAAGRLFAERGYETTSVRDITTEADCNVASVNYHFGGKENLYIEAFRVLLAELRDLRIETLRRGMAGVDDPTLEYFLATFAEGFVDPLVGDSKGRRFVILINREMADPRLPREMFVEEFLEPMMSEAGQALMSVVPSLDRKAARLSLMSMVSQLLHALMIRRHFIPEEGAEVVPVDLAAHVEHIVRFTAGGITACAAERDGQPVRSVQGSEA